MSDTGLLTVAIFVFVMMIIGLGLTVWEFSRGQPHREAEEAKKDSRAHRQAA
jgi:cbb3-type cytochrome oxidase subunit 3